MSDVPPPLPPDRDAPAAPAAPPKSGVWPALRAAVSRMAQGHFHTLLYAAFGLIAALLILFAGFWQALLVIGLVAIGAAIGLYQDGNAFLRMLVARLLKRLS
ncbi:DUF2273 domain-containing protein [Eggerthellaceae bacterium zg-893]|nr:DUF2273 domain-containing protein [Eggerthellaceae bacterium zg-893]